MFHVPDLNEVAFAGDYSQSGFYAIEHNDVNLDEVIRLTEDLQAADDSDYPDWCEPIEE